MIGHMASFLSTQFDASSIGMLIYAYMSSYMMQCSYSHFFISLASSPTLGAKLCHIWALYKLLGVGLNLKERERQDTQSSSCDHHLFTIMFSNM